MTTPEGKIKDKIKILLAEYHVYWLMPVQTGYGAAGLDFHCVLPGGLAFFIEAKANDKAPITAREDKLLEKIHSMGIQTFIVEDDQSLRKLRMWLDANTMVSLRIPMVKIK